MRAYKGSMREQIEKEGYGAYLEAVRKATEEFREAVCNGRRI